MVTPERAEAIAAWKKGDDAAYIEDEIRWATKTVLQEAAGDY
jgi:hypothetical protein